MNQPPDPAGKAERASVQFDAVLAEYTMCRESIANYRQMQSNLDNIALVALGLSVPTILSILERDPSAIGAIYLLPILFFTIAFTQFRFERHIAFFAFYTHDEVRSAAITLLDTLHAGGPAPFNLELGWRANPINRHWLLNWLGVISRAAVSLSSGLALIAVGVYIQAVLLGGNWHGFEVWLWVVDALLLAVSLSVAAGVARRQHEFYKRIA